MTTMRTWRRCVSDWPAGSRDLSVINCSFEFDSNVRTGTGGKHKCLLRRSKRLNAFIGFIWVQNKKSNCIHWVQNVYYRQINELYTFARLRLASCGWGCARHLCAKFLESQFGLLQLHALDASFDCEKRVQGVSECFGACH